jgi:hypothetical protein
MTGPRFSRRMMRLAAIMLALATIALARPTPCRGSDDGGR